VQGAQYVVNDGEPKTIGDEGWVQLQAGDQFCLVDLEYYAEGNARDDAVSAEAYIRKGGREERNIDYDDGRFSGGDAIYEGTHRLGALDRDSNRERNPCWDVEKEWNRVIIALVQNYGNRAEVDDRFYINLDVE
jgi:hypothetical protein